MKLKYIGIALLFIGCGYIAHISLNNFLENTVKSIWPTLDIASAKQQSVDRLRNELLKTNNPNIAVFIGKEKIIKHLKKIIDSTPGLSNTSIDFEDQFISVSANFRIDNSLPNSVVRFGLNNFSFFGKMKAYVTPIVNEEEGLIRFQLIFDTVDISSVDIGINDVGKNLSNKVSGLVNSFLIYINGIINAECAKITNDQTIKIDNCIQVFNNPIIETVNLDKLNNSKDIYVTGNTVNLSAKIESSVILINNDGLHLLAKLHLIDLPSSVDENHSNLKEANIASLTNEFLNREKQLYSNNYTDNDIWLSIKVALLKEILEYYIGASSIKIDIKHFGNDETFNTKIRLAKRPRFECRPEMECDKKTRREVDCKPFKENKCIRAGGFIAKTINHVCNTITGLTCEGGKAAGTIIEETIQVLDKGQCELSKTLKKAGCEVNKGFVDNVFGKIGNISGHYNINGTMTAFIDNGEVASDLSTVRLKLRATASGKASGSIKFVPINSGHLLVCISQWKEPFEVRVSFAEKQYTLAASLVNKVTDDRGNLIMEFVLDKLKLVAKVTPSPFSAIFDSHPHLRINCSLPSTLGELARFISLVDGNSDILPDELNSAVSGAYTEELDNLRFKVVLPLRNLIVDKSEYSLHPSLNEGNIIYFTKQF